MNMNPTVMKDVDTASHQANITTRKLNKQNSNFNASPPHITNGATTPTTTPTSTATSTDVATATETSLPNTANNTNNTNAEINGHTLPPSLHNGNTNANGSTNGGAPNLYQNGSRRDSTQVWTPLLPNGSGGEAANGGVLDGIDTTSSITVDPADLTTVIFDPPNSNNNDWKSAEEIRNFKNGLLHHPPISLKSHLNHEHLNHLEATSEANHIGNNNGSLLNGKAGNVLPDKYDEQDPLTGPYPSQRQHRHAGDSDASDFDSDVSRNARNSPTCGFFGCRPKWAHSLASTNSFMIVFLLAYILQGMYMTYFVSVITTIEKLFQIKSKTTGFLLSASEMGQISTAMLLTYFAGRGHRPRWIACGMVLFSVAAFACALPHFIFGDQLIKSAAFLNKGNEESLVANNAWVGGQLQEWNSSKLPVESVTMAFTTVSRGNDENLCLAGNNETKSGNAECNENRKLEQASHSKITVIVLCIFFASLLSSGIGQTAVSTLGIPYIDDNVASKQSPMYIAITIGVRILGPASGFVVGSFCTRVYVNFSNPRFDASDPRWIGAWWLGPVVIGSLIFLSAIVMFSFPKQLRGRTAPTGNCEQRDIDIAANEDRIEVDEKPKLKDFPKTVRRQLSNDILMFRTASCVFHLLPIAGLYTFLPKYLETQFRLASYDANMIAGFCGILVMGIGIIISAIVILKLSPTAKSVAAWIAFTALVYSAGMAILMFVGCDMDDFAGYNPSTRNTSAFIEPACQAALNCTCDRENFAPICGTDGKMYISTCHAGCTTSGLYGNDNRTVFSNCACIPDLRPGNETYEAVTGYCDNNCKNFILFILIFALCVFMHSTCEVGSMLLVMRCTHPKDKAMAMGVIQSAIGLFGNVPCPIIYGAVVDSACLIWKSVCGKHGACSLYDATTFRHYFLGITSGIMFLAFIMDLVVWSKAHRIDIVPKDTLDACDVKKPIKNGSKNVSTPPDTTV